MKLIKLILFLTVVLFLHSCTSTKSVVNCPTFKPGKKPVLKVSKVKRPKTKKNVAFQKSQTKKATKKRQGQTKKLNRLQTQLIDRIVDTDIRVPLKEHYHLGKELSRFQKEFILDNDLEAITANTTKVRAGGNRKSGNLKFKPQLKIANPESPVLNNANTSFKNQKQSIKKPNEDVQNSKDDRVEPLALIGLLFSLASLIIFGIPFGLTGAVLGIIGLIKFKKYPDRRGRALAVLAMLLGLVSAFLVVIILS